MNFFHKLTGKGFGNMEIYKTDKCLNTIQRVAFTFIADVKKIIKWEVDVKKSISGKFVELLSLTFIAIVKNL